MIGNALPLSGGDRLASASTRPTRQGPPPQLRIPARLPPSAQAGCTHTRRPHQQFDLLLLHRLPARARVALGRRRRGRRCCRRSGRRGRRGRRLRVRRFLETRGRGGLCVIRCPRGGCRRGRGSSTGLSRGCSIALWASACFARRAARTAGGRGGSSAGLCAGRGAGRGGRRSARRGRRAVRLGLQRSAARAGVLVELSNAAALGRASSCTCSSWVRWQAWSRLG
jgi:hypothetical protein